MTVETLSHQDTLLLPEREVSHVELKNSYGLSVHLALEHATDDEQATSCSLIVGGFGSHHEKNTELRSALVGRLDTDAATMSYSEQPLGDLLDTDEVRVADVLAVIRYLAQIKDKIELVTHSMGAAITADVLVELARQRDYSTLAKIDCFIMINGAGMIQGDGIDEILPRLRETLAATDELGEKNGFGKLPRKRRGLRERVANFMRTTADAINAARNKSIET